MKILLSWLKEYIDINLPPVQIGKLLTSAGLEVDAIESVKMGFEKVIVGKVTAVVPHPSADKLRIATVSDGSQSYQVVCGAPNCREGIKTAFAIVGAKLRDKEGKEFTISVVKLRNVESYGMLCSGVELGISAERDGILEFAEHVKEGSDVAEMYADVIFDISLTPNLGHCQSIIGVARELSAATGLPVKYPPISVQEDEWETIEKQVQVFVQDLIKCPRYTCRLVRDVVIAPSPIWLKKRLEACGFRSINNVVDITNYVLLELGHPLHAFDFDALSGHQIHVKTASQGEGFMTLDNKKRELTEDDLLICDQNKPVAIAGVMGGLISEVSNTTRHVLIESAYFQPASIRRTSKRLGLQTDASKRFERGTDPNGILLALDRAAMLIQQLAGGRTLKGVIDVKAQEFPEKQLLCRLNRLNTLLGTHLGINEIENIFQRLGFGCSWNGKNGFEIKIPTFRSDILEEIDLIEEVARIYGYDKIPKVYASYQGTRLPDAPIFQFEREVRIRLLREGLQEFLTCDLIGPSLMNIVQERLMPVEAEVKVINPTSIEQSILRTSLLPGLLQVVKYNVDHQNSNIQGFEIGRSHFREGGQYKEQSIAAIILSGNSRPWHWDRKPADVDFYDLKGILENIFKEWDILPEFKPLAHQIFHSGRQAAIFVDSLEVGSMGEIHPSIQRRLDVPQRILFAELNLHDIFQRRLKEQKMKEIPIFPSSSRDWTVTLPEEISVGQVLSILHRLPSPYLEQISVLDLFQSDKLGKGKKNVTFHFIYRDKSKTIDMETVEREHEKLIAEGLKLITGSSHA